MGINSCSPTRPCPPPKPFCYIRDCSTSCPSYTLIFNNTFCMDSDECNKLGWKNYENKCIQECPRFTYGLQGVGYWEGMMVCDTMVASIATSVILLTISFLSCALCRYQLTSKHSTEEENQTNEAMTDTRPLLDTDQTEVMGVWTDHRVPSSRTTAGINSSDLQCNYSDDDPLLDIRPGLDAGFIHSEDSHPVFRDDDEFSSVPTVCRLHGNLDDSVDISEYSTGTDRDSGVTIPHI